MKCRYCGMESRTPQICEWCKKPMAAVPGQPPQVQVPQPTGIPLTGPAPVELTQTMASQQQARTQRVSLTGEVIDVPAPQPTQMINTPIPPGQPGMAPAPTAMGTMAQGALPFSAYDAGVVNAQYQNTGVGWFACFEMFLAIAMPVLLGAVVLLHAFPSLNIYIITLILVIGILSTAMGATRTIPAFEEAYGDVFIMLIVTFLFGPTVALVIHGIVGFFKQEWNGAIVGLLLMFLIANTVLILAMGTSGSFNPMAFLSFGVISSMIMAIVYIFCIFLSFAGWMLSGVFRPMNEL